MIYKFFYLIQILLLIFFLILFVVGLLYSIFFDRLLRYEYTNHRTEWEKDGKMSGHLWTAPESTFLGKMFRTTGLLAKKWADEKPEWIWEDAKGTELYNAFLLWRRIFFIVASIFGLIVGGFVAFNFSGFNK